MGLLSQIIVQELSKIFYSIDTHLNDSRSRILIVISMGWLLSIGIRLTYPVLLPYLRNDLGMSLSTAGLLLTLLWLAYAFGQLPGGILADKIGEGTTMVLSMVIAAGALSLVLASSSVLILFVSTSILGFAVALFGVVRLTAIADVYPDKIGTAHGIMAASGDIGNTILPPLAGIIAAATLWQFGFGMFIPAFTIVAIALWVVVPVRTSESKAVSNTLSLQNIQKITTELRHPPITIITLIMTLNVTVIQSFIGFYPTYLNEMKGISAPLASGIFAFFFILGVLIKPLAGRGYDRSGAKRMIISLSSVSGFALVCLVYSNNLLSIMAVTILLSAMLGRGTIALSYITAALSKDVQNTGLGIIRTFYFTVSAMGPLLFGIIADRGFFDEAFLILATLSGVIIIFAVKLSPDKI